VRGTAIVCSDISTLSGLSALSGASPGQFSLGGLLVGGSEGGAYIGRTGIRESSWQVLSGTEGLTWVIRTGAGNRFWSCIAMSSDGKIQTAVASGTDSIYTSYDYGVTWIQRTGAGNRNWVRVAISSDGRIQTAVVGGGFIYTSYDYGVTWIQRGESNYYYGLDVSSDGRIQVAVNAFNIYTSYDYGVTWVTRLTLTGSGFSLRGIAISSDGRIQTASVDGRYLYTSYDYGVTWIARTEAGNRFWSDIAMSSDGKIQTAVVRNGNYIYTSYDYGVTWIARTEAGSKEWYHVNMSSDGRIQTVSVNGTDFLYISYNYGVTWVQRGTSKSYAGTAMSSDGRIQAAIENNGPINISFATIVTPDPVMVLNSLSSAGVIYASNGNSDNWNIAYNTVFNSGKYDSVYTTVSANSANWDTAYNNIPKYNSNFTSFSTNSAKYESNYTTTTTYSAGWGGLNKTVVSVDMNLLAAAGTNYALYTVPTGKRFVVEEVTYVINAVTGSVKGTLPTMQIYRTTNTGTAYQMSNSFDYNGATTPSFPAINYWYRTGNLASTTGRAVATAGETVYSRIVVNYSGGNLTVLNATCLVSGYII
jgi:hypothetical protein